MSNQLFGGSICITDLMEQLTAKHSSFSKSTKNGKVYCNILIWHNEEKDKFGNNIGIQLSSIKERQEAEGKIYIGNARKIETNKPVGKNDLPAQNWDADIPVREPGATAPAPAATPAAAPAADDLPF